MVWPGGDLMITFSSSHLIAPMLTAALHLDPIKLLRAFTSYFFFHPLHRNRISSGYDYEKRKKVISFYTFFSFFFYFLVTCFCFYLQKSVVALSFFAMLTGICFYALRYGPSPYALPAT